MRPAAEERLEKRLVMAQVAELEGLSVEPEEIESEIDRLAEMMEDRAEEMREMLASPAGRLSVADELIGTKVQSRITEIGKGEAPPLEDAEGESEEEPDSETTDDEPEVKPEAAEDLPVEDIDAGEADESPDAADAEAETEAKEAEDAGPDEEPTTEDDN